MKPELPETVYYPIESLEEKYNSGSMDKLKIHLYTFIDRHKPELQVKINSIVDPTRGKIILLIKDFIEKKGSIHPPSEMADLIKEIKKEIWYRGEEGDTDTKSIEEDWQRQYSKLWREARQIEVLYLVDKFQDEILQSIRD